MTELQNAFDNEDTLWGAFILPTLIRAGLDASQLVLEKTFAVRLGRQKIELGGFVNTDALKRARLDLLVRRKSDAHPICIIEFKRPGQELTIEDGEQAVSYARLLPQMAPLAVVTNGDTWWYFDAVGGRRLSPDEVPSAAASTPASSPDLIADGLRVFFALTPANIAQFCRTQVDAATWPLRTERDQEPPIYAAELYVEPPGITKSLTSALQSQHRIFPILGPSGHGKSALAVHLAYGFLDQSLAVFF